MGGLTLLPGSTGGKKIYLIRIRGGGNLPHIQKNVQWKWFSVFDPSSSIDSHSAQGPDLRVHQCVTPTPTLEFLFLIGCRGNRNNRRTCKLHTEELNLRLLAARPHHTTMLSSVWAASNVIDKRFVQSASRFFPKPAPPFVNVFYWLFPRWIHTVNRPDLESVPSVVSG